MRIEEPDVIINNTKLSIGQAMTLRVAVANFQFQLQEKAYMDALGGIGPLYQIRLNEITRIMLGEEKDG